MVLGGNDGWDPRRVAAYPSAVRANAAPLPRPPGPAVAGPQSPPALTWDQVARQPASWLATPEALRIAENVRLYQRHTGGWPKNLDMAQPLTDADRARLTADRALDDSTIDNGATTRQIEFLARMAAATRDERAQASMLAGIDYLLAAQYPNGGWPQYFPLRNDYSRHITFNDDAMIAAATLLQSVALARPPFAGIDAARRRRAGGGRHARPSRDSGLADSRQRPADWLVPAARCEDARARARPHLRASIDQRPRDRDHRQFPAFDRASATARRRPPSMPRSSGSRPCRSAAGAPSDVPIPQDRAVTTW